MIAFWLFIITSVGLIGLLGESDGVKLAISILVATVATFVINAYVGFTHGQPYTLLVDVLLLVMVLYIASNSISYWPLWFCGFHAIAVATGLAHFVFSGALPLLYVNLAGFWAIPAISAALIGIWLDHRASCFRNASSTRLDQGHVSTDS